MSQGPAYTCKDGSGTGMGKTSERAIGSKAQTRKTTVILRGGKF